MTPGYSYTLVAGRCFVNAAVSIGPAYSLINYRVNDVDGSVQTFNAFADVRFGLGYNGERFFTGLTWVSQSRTARVNEVTVGNSSVTIRLLAGYRFKEFGILKKRAFDLLPFDK